MQQFREGVRKFRQEMWPRKQALFRRLAKAQAPKALFLTCADSRVLPVLFTSSGPGELFVERNPGNIVPVYSDDLVGVTASIEYAAAVLQVPEIIVCGHTDCGAMRALLSPEKMERLPAVARWLTHAEQAVEMLRALHPDAAPEEALDRLTELNVRLQIEHLKTHPSVQKRLVRGDLAVYGWVYDIAEGLVRALDEETNEFSVWPD